MILTPYDSFGPPTACQTPGCSLRGGVEVYRDQDMETKVCGAPYFVGPEESPRGPRPVFRGCFPHAHAFEDALLAKEAHDAASQ